MAEFVKVFVRLLFLYMIYARDTSPEIFSVALHSLTWQTATEYFIQLVIMNREVMSHRAQSSQKKFYKSNINLKSSYRHVTATN